MFFIYQIGIAVINGDICPGVDKEIIGQFHNGRPPSGVKRNVKKLCHLDGTIAKLKFY